MASSIHHAKSSAKRWGGDPHRYLPIHEWFDSSKEIVPDQRHRAMRHHATGVSEAIRIFGHEIDNGEGRKVPVRWIAEQHVVEDLGFIPNAADWFRSLKLERWMTRSRKLSQELEQDKEEAGSCPTHGR